MIDEVKKILEHYFSDAIGLESDGDIAKEICQLFPKTKDNPDGYEPKPDKPRRPRLETECQCGHYLEEHDWGAYRKDEAACLVVGCKCMNFVREAISKLSKEGVK